MKSKNKTLSITCWVGSRLDKPVRTWLAELDDQSFKQLDNLLSMLRQERNNLSMPYSRHLGEGLFELRDQRQSGPGYRLYYCWDGDVIVILLVGGNKRTQEHDIEITRQRMKFKEQNYGAFDKKTIGKI